MMGTKRLTLPEKLHKIWFLLFGSISFLEGVLVVLWLINIPADPKNALLLGYSSRRLILIAVVVIFEALITGLSIYALKRQAIRAKLSQTIQSKNIRKVSCTLGLLLAFLILIPASEMGRAAAWFSRLIPFLVWLCLLLLQWSLAGWLLNDETIPKIKDWMSQKFHRPRTLLIALMGILIFGFLLSVWVYPAAKGEDYWYETGVPILFWQILLTTGLCILFFRNEQNIEKFLGKKLDITLSLLIFIFCGLLWGLTPLAPSYFNPAPAPPNNVYYPYSDARDFDLQAQITLLGHGFDNGTPLDRPFYPLFLAFLHLISGQNYAINVFVQAFLFAIFPALVFLIGTELGSRTWGLAAASAIGLWGYNTILSQSLLNTATPKQLLTDFPLAIALSLILYFSIRWIKDEPRAKVYALITGGFIALASYIRYSALALLPLWMIVALIIWRIDLKKSLLMAALLLAGFSLLTAPWYTRNILYGKEISIPFSGKVIFVIKDRYQPVDKTNIEETPTEIGYERNRWTGSTPKPIENATRLVTETPRTRKVNQQKNSAVFSAWFPVHLVHNMMSSLLILPTSLEIASLKTSLSLAGSIWQPDWNGNLPVSRTLMLLIQFFILSSGIIGIYSHNKNAALIILLLFLGVQLANSLGRTSGGRYIIPVLWLVLLVYMAGVLFLLNALRFKSGSLTTKPFVKHPLNWKQWGIAIFSLLFIGALPGIFESITKNVIPKQSEIIDFQEIKLSLDATSSLQEITEVELFLNQPLTRTFQGYAFYPEQSKIMPSSKIQSKLGSEEQFVALSFLLIGPEKNTRIIFPFNHAIDIQNQDRVYVIGCKLSGTMYARNLYILRDDTTLSYQSDYIFDTCKRLSK